MTDPGMQVDPSRVIEAMQKRFSQQVANYETQIAMMQVAIDDLQHRITELEVGGTVIPVDGVPMQEI